MRAPLMGVLIFYPLIQKKEMQEQMKKAIMSRYVGFCLFAATIICCVLGITACGAADKQSELESEPVAGVFELESPYWLEGAYVFRQEYVFYMSGRVNFTAYATINGQLITLPLSGVYVYPKESDYIYLTVNGEDVIDLLYEGSYIYNGYARYNLRGANEDGEFAGKVALLEYTSGEGGTVTGDLIQYVQKGTNGTAVTAVPDEGYAFDSWSDGLLTAERMDVCITENTKIQARFSQVADFYDLRYNAGAGGSIKGASQQRVMEGKDGTSVVAVPEDGHIFIGWSDGVETAERQDTNIRANLTVTAQFIPTPEYALTYLAGFGGFIKGDSEQMIIMGENGSPVTAVPDDGYVFVRWSDGITTAERTELSVNGDVTVTALFEKVGTFYFGGGEGTEKEPYLISEEKHLNEMYRYPCAHYKVVQDIEVAADGKYISRFTVELPFEGTFDGNGKTISGLNIVPEGNVFSGLFGCLGASGSVRNLDLENISVRGAVYTGGIAGVAYGHISLCRVEGKFAYSETFNADTYFGGIAGFYSGTDTQGLVSFVHTVISFPSGTDKSLYAGGLFGYLNKKIKLENSSSSGSISVQGDKVYAGGMGGCVDAEESEFNNNNSSCSVSVTADSYAYAGGAFGYINGCITDCGAEGSVSVYDGYNAYAGGLVGYYTSDAVLSACTAKGMVSVTADNAGHAGGLIGYFDCIGSAGISGCTAEGNISSNSSAGGLISLFAKRGGAFAGNGGTVSDCRAYGTVSGLSRAGGLIAVVEVDEATIDNCGAEGKISGNISGGLIASCFGIGCSLTRCYASGNVSASLYAGGLVGSFSENTSDKHYIENCYTTGEVMLYNPTTTAYAGGLVGYIKTSRLALSNSYTVSPVISADSQVKQYLGGLIGYTYSRPSTLLNVHWMTSQNSDAEYAMNVNMNNSYNGTSVKHISIEDFYTLAEVLNGEQGESIWEHKGQGTLPTFAE